MVKLLENFKAFILRGNVVELAVGVVIGVAFGNVIAALVKDLFTPLIAALGAQPDFGGLVFTVNRSRFRYGDFIDAALDFVIIAAVVYFLVVAPMNRLTAQRRGPEQPTTRKCSECLSEIPLGARRCSHCTSPQVPEPV
jgi:large conductance mechanosensitive channel